MKHIQTKYYRFIPGEFLPIYTDGGEMVNKWEFHRYKIKSWRRTYWQLTHQIG